MSRDAHERLRIRSTRGYRRIADQALRDAMLGKRSAQDAAAIVAAAKAGCEMFMAEATLARAGIDEDSGAQHPLGMDGGVELGNGKVFRRKKIKVRTGIGKMGERIDDKSVEVETAAEDDEAEAQAEAETLS